MRKVLNIKGVEHRAPIPMGAQIGNMIFTSGVMGSDPETGKIPDDAASQVKFAFINLRALLAVGGASPADIAHMHVMIKDDSVRPLLNEEWIKMFPDENDRPARHADLVNLPTNLMIEFEVIAVIDDKK